MSLQLRKSSTWWYAQFVVDGKRQTFNLDVKVRGQPPRSINKKGDQEFEASRVEALAAHDRRKRELESDQHGIQAAQTVVRLRTGLNVQFPMLENLVAAWESAPRRRAPSAVYVDQCRRSLTRFKDFMERQHPGVSRMVDITDDMASEFMASEEQRGISGKQYNEELKLLRSAYRRQHQSLGIMSNPFYSIPFKEVTTIHRRPYSPEELRRIFDAVRDDDFMRPLVVCGMSTAMRLGDCALLRWTDVDLIENYVRVKTHKTGETVEIPIFAPLRDELTRSNRSGEHVFPDQAAMYRSNPSGLSYRFKKILIKAGFAEKSTTVEDGPAQTLPNLPDDELRRRGYAYIDQMKRPINKPNKPDLMRDVFDLYLAGKTIPESSDAVGVSRGTASNYLNELEHKLGASLVRRRPTGVRTAEGLLRAERVKGMRRASTMDFHSFRVTWVTLALTRGIPMDLVRVVTGHRTVEIVLKHYFRPQRQEIREAFLKNMPALLTTSTKQGDHGQNDVQSVLAEANEQNAWETIKRLKAVLSVKGDNTRQ